MTRREAQNENNAIIENEDVTTVDELALRTQRSGSNTFGRERGGRDCFSDQAALPVFAAYRKRKYSHD